MGTNRETIQTAASIMAYLSGRIPKEGQRAEDLRRFSEAKVHSHKKLQLLTSSLWDSKRG